MILGEIEMKINSVFETEEGKNAVIKFYTCHLTTIVSVYFTVLNQYDVL